MQSPQVENGFTRIANEIMDALVSYRIPGEQMQCLLFILRKTYGYGKKHDAISNSQLCKATGLKKGNASRAIKDLVNKNIVIKSDNGVIKSDNCNVPTYCFNKNYSEWVQLSKKQPVIKLTTKVIETDNKPLSKVMDTKEKKETLQKKTTYTTLDARNFLLSLGVQDQHITDWLAVRKAKKLSPTKTGLEKIVREAEKAGLSMATVIQMCCEKCWGGFEAKWMREDNNGKPGTSSKRIGFSEPGQHGKTDWLS